MKIKTLFYIKSAFKSFALVVLILIAFSFRMEVKKNNYIPKTKKVTAKDILGNPNYLAICYGGYRQKTRDIQPTIEEVKEDLKILSVLKIKVIRTYNVHLKEVATILKAIEILKKEDKHFEMYVMLGAWIDCKNAWTKLEPNHDVESDRNAIEIDEAVRLSNKYPDIIKIISVGNEAMVKWATSYYVQSNVILKWVNHLQELKKSNKLPKDLWITSSDDFASWGGGDESYKTKDLEDLINAVDYVSMHTYPYHNSHYHSDFWKVPQEEDNLSDVEKVNSAMNRSLEFAKMQYNTVKNYVHSINPNKPVHIGETGWASSSDGLYGNDGSKASDEYKQALIYNAMRAWTNKEGIACFFFEAFDEPWKDSGNPSGSENHFGLLTVDGKAKFALWNDVDKKVFNGLKRNGNAIDKTYNGNSSELMKTVLIPPRK
ncbi:glycosyl hydrolase family 17 [Flavobacterium sp. SUN052]|uniref:glycosyl hydrolase family 17 n=1 Tax=Flavobacterium sp. SUN052 TaxID=3002441 RepID=UPI00237EABAB|nr:glycosyl hydrolase family 17 [Flavobacterium sp. SUN052]MEC4004977.1 glycosyl hydrolase family 17 [Flavobacterium sp. SUN052]